MQPIFNIKRHDLQPYLPFIIPSASDLVGAVITCTMVNNANSVAKIDKEATGCIITDAAAREAEYRWQPGDTDTSGTYKIEFEIVPQAGGKFTVPSKDDGDQFVLISDDLDGV